MYAGELAALLKAEDDGRHGHLEEIELHGDALAQLIPVQRVYTDEEPPAQ